MDLTELGVAAAAAAVATRDASAVDVTASALARIAATDDALRAWVTVDAPGALAQARARDEDLAAGRPIGPLHGVPIGIKDIVDVAGLPTTAGAGPFAHTQPSADARLVARLRAAGAVIVGKTVATPFAYKDPASTTNPWSVERTPGGSSSGSAAAVAARQVPAAIGTQTVGSILRPSAFCGVVGLKGAHGDVPLDGVLPLAPTLDHAGPITRSVADAALVEGVLRGRRIAIPDLDRPLLATSHVLFDQASPELQAHLETTLAHLLDAGAEVVEIELPSSFMALLEAGVAILEAEAAEVHATWFRDHADEYGPQIGGLVRAGLARDPASVARAREVRAAFQSAIAPLLEGVDALLSPVAPGPAPLRSEGTGDFMLCAPWSFAGVPSIGIPTGLDAAGLPLALQLVGASRALERLLGAAAWCERMVAFDARPSLTAPALTDELWSRSATWLARAIAAREVSSLEVVDACLGADRGREPADQRRRAARGGRPATGLARRTRRWRTARRTGPLHGVPFTIKDSMDTAGVVTTAGTIGWRERIPDRDATVVARLRAAGGILVGKTNTPEFTWANETDNDVYGRTSNPYDLDRSPGGSSGGSASIVAAGGSPFDIGSDSGNSIRQPAHLCGVAGHQADERSRAADRALAGARRPVRVVHAAGTDRAPGRGPRAGPAAHRRPGRRGPARRVPVAARRPGARRRRRAARRVVRRQRHPDADARDARRRRRAPSRRSRRPGPPSRSTCRPTSSTRGRPGRRSIRADGFAWLWRLIEAAGTPGHGSYDRFGWVAARPGEPLARRRAVGGRRAGRRRPRTAPALDAALRPPRVAGRCRCRRSGTARAGRRSTATRTARSTTSRAGRRRSSGRARRPRACRSASSSSRSRGARTWRWPRPASSRRPPAAGRQPPL